MAKSAGGQVDTVMKEERLFRPSEKFASDAQIQSFEEYEKLWSNAATDNTAFWAEAANEIHWV